MAKARSSTTITLLDGTVKTTSGSGTVKFTKNGLLHCEYGPAVIYSHGPTDWYLYGKAISEWRLILPKTCRIPNRKFITWSLEDQIAFKLTIAPYV